MVLPSRFEDGFPRQDLEFVHALIARAGLSRKQIETITPELKKVEARASSDTLNLAVLGEFNSGKSTFINALLRLPLLKSALKATTAAATMIRFGGEFTLQVDFDDGSSVSASGGRCDQLIGKLRNLGQGVSEETSIGQLLDMVTVEPSVTVYVRQVEIAIPAASLGKRLCIIDTPGIGAGMEYAQSHDAVTTRVTTEIADAAVILIPADNAMTQTLMSFLNEKAQRFLHRCVFVITKMDHIEEADRPKVREFVATKLSRVLETQPTILEAAATTMLPAKQVPAYLQEAWTYWQDKFRSMEAAIQEELARNHNIIIGEHLAVLLQSLLTNLQEAIGVRRATLKEEQVTLEQNSVARLGEVLGRLLQQGRTMIEAEIEASKSKIQQDAVIFENQAKQTAKALLEQADKDSIERVLRDNVPAAVNQAQQQFDQESEKHLASVRRTCERLQSRFVQEFESSYKNLRALGAKIDVRNIAPVSPSLAAGHFNSAQQVLRVSQRTREKAIAITKVLGGLLAAPAGGCLGSVLGAILGAMVGSWQGFFVGIFLGGFLGFALAASRGGKAGAKVGARWGNLEQWRQEVFSELAPDIHAHVEKILSVRYKDFDHARDAALGALNKTIEEHTQAYSTVVDRMLSDHQQKTAQLAQEEKQAELDSAELLSRTESLASKRVKLLAAHGC